MSNAKILLKANKLMKKYHEKSLNTYGDEWCHQVNMWFVAQACADEAMKRMTLADWGEYENER